MGTVKLDLERTTEVPIRYEVVCEVSVDPGVRTFGNGDPGYPGSVYFNALEFFLDGKKIDPLELTDSEIEYLTERACEALSSEEEGAMEYDDDRSGD